VRVCVLTQPRSHFSLTVLLISAALYARLYLGFNVPMPQCVGP